MSNLHIWEDKWKLLFERGEIKSSICALCMPQMHSSKHRSWIRTKDNKLAYQVTVQWSYHFDYDVFFSIWIIINSMIEMENSANDIIIIIEISHELV